MERNRSHGRQEPHAKGLVLPGRAPAAWRRAGSAGDCAKLGFWDPNPTNALQEAHLALSPLQDRRRLLCHRRVTLTVSVDVPNAQCAGFVPEVWARGVSICFQNLPSPRVRTIQRSEKAALTLVPTRSLLLLSFFKILT